MDTVLGCMATDSIASGEYTQKLAKNAKDLFQYETAAALRSPYIALCIALKSLGFNRGAKVAISALAPLYHKTAVEDCGLEPSWYDHHPDTCVPLLGGDALAGCSAVILFDALGILPDVEEMGACSLPVIEDMTQALGASKSGKRAGSFGSVSLYGMEQGSIVTAGGGALLFSATKKASQAVRTIAESQPEEMNMTDYNAALGLARLKDFQSAYGKRSELENAFQAEIARTNHTTLRQEGEGSGGCYSFPVLVDSGMRDVILHARKNGVEAAPAFEKSLVSMENFPREKAPNAYSLSLRCVSFPLHQRISSADAALVRKVIATLP